MAGAQCSRWQSREYDETYKQCEQERDAVKSSASFDGRSVLVRSTSKTPRQGGRARTPDSCQNMTCRSLYRLRVCGVLASSRAPSTKSNATGLSVRLFSVTIPLGTRAMGSSTGKTLSSARLVGNLKAEAGKIVR